MHFYSFRWFPITKLNLIHMTSFKVIPEKIFNLVLLFFAKLLLLLHRSLTSFINELCLSFPQDELCLTLPQDQLCLILPQDELGLTLPQDELCLILLVLYLCRLETGKFFICLAPIWSPLYLEKSYWRLEKRWSKGKITEKIIIWSLQCRTILPDQMMY